MFALRSLKLSLALISGLLSILTVHALPAELSETDSRNASELISAKEASTNVAAPHFVIYSDAPTSGQIGPPPVSQVKVRSHRSFIRCMI